MKKILGLSIAIILLVLTLGGGTWAYFVDNETSTGNALDSGTLDLKIDGGDAAVNTFSAHDVLPGDTGGGSVTLANAGSLPGELDITVSTVSNSGGVGAGEFEDGVGHLGGKAKMAVYLDIDASGSWNAGDIGLKHDGTTYAYPSKLKYAAINKYSGTHWDAAASMAPAAKFDLLVEWKVPGETGNEIQGDAVSFGIMFTLEQPEAD